MKLKINEEINRESMKPKSGSLQRSIRSKTPARLRRKKEDTNYQYQK